MSEDGLQLTAVIRKYEEAEATINQLGDRLHQLAFLLKFVVPLFAGEGFGEPFAVLNDERIRKGKGRVFANRNGDEDRGRSGTKIIADRHDGADDGEGDAGEQEQAQRAARLGFVPGGILVPAAPLPFGNPRWRRKRRVFANC